MIHTYERPILAAGLGALLLAGAAAADTLTYPITPPATTCGTTWSENLCGFVLTETTEDDYTDPGFCVALPNPEGIILMGCRMELDLCGVAGIETVHLDVTEGAGLMGCTRLFVLDAVGNQIAYAWTDRTGFQTLAVAPSGVPAKVIVSGHECLIWEIRVLGSALSPDAPTWGGVKGLYR
jgi:hypothetical protein